MDTGKLGGEGGREGPEPSGTACSRPASSTFTAPAKPPSLIRSGISKWLDGHADAVSITYDIKPDPSEEPDVAGYMTENGMVLD